MRWEACQRWGPCMQARSEENDACASKRRLCLCPGLEASPRSTLLRTPGAGSQLEGRSWGGARRRADLLADNPFNTLKLGCDFLRHHALPQIDFATAHLCALGAVRLCSFARERRTAPTET